MSVNSNRLFVVGGASLESWHVKEGGVFNVMRRIRQEEIHRHHGPFLTGKVNC